MTALSPEEREALRMVQEDTVYLDQFAHTRAEVHFLALEKQGLIHKDCDLMRIDPMSGRMRAYWRCSSDVGEGLLRASAMTSEDRALANGLVDAGLFDAYYRLTDKGREALEGV